MKSYMAKSFSWSWSKLKNYRSCPKRHYEIDLARNYHEDKTNEALTWGNQLHDAFAKRISHNQPLPLQMARYDDIAFGPSHFAKLKEMGSDITVEKSLAIDRQFRPCGWFDNDTWMRAKIDVNMLIPASAAALTIDWKTGSKIEPEFEQLGISAQTIFANHPEVQEVTTMYVWLGHDQTTTKVYKRDEMVPFWNALLPSIEQMYEAWRTLTYEPKPSGLCIRHCPVTSCPYHGKGSPR